MCWTTRCTGAPLGGWMTADDLEARGYSPCRGFKHCFNVTFSYFLLSFSFSFKISLVPALPGALWRLSIVDALRASSLYVCDTLQLYIPPLLFLSSLLTLCLLVFCCFGPVWGHRVLVLDYLLRLINADFKKKKKRTRNVWMRKTLYLITSGPWL